MASTTAFSASGKTAIITGGGSGINLAFAASLLSQGCNVVIGDLSLRPEAQAIIEQYSAAPEYAPRAIFLKTDVTKWSDLEALFTTAETHFGGSIDIVCPGAGVFEPHWTNFWHPPGTERSRDQLHGTEVEGIGHYACLDINLTHPIRCSQLAISRWLNPPAGVAKVSSETPKRIVHISSIAGQVPGFAHPLYNASKHAINGFVRSLAPLEKLGIRVNCVAPGIIKTPLWMEHPEKLAMLDQDVDEWVEPEEVAAAMMRCVADPAVGAGVVLEVTKGATREVGYINDPGPSGRGASVSKRDVVRDEVFEWLAEDGWGVPRA